MKILVSGFDPFGGEKVNPAIESVKKLPDTILGAEIIKLEIPTVIGKSIQKIEEAVELHKPDVVISVGQAGGRTDITVERVGVNVKDGPDAYFVTLPIKAMVEHIQKKGVPASVSNTAGTFICNHVTYGVRHLAETKYPEMRTGFIHIPFLPQQVLDKKGMPSMELDVIVKGLVAAIEAVIQTDEDIKVTGGAIS